MAAADVVDQLSRRGDGYALGRDDHQVIAVGEVHRFEQRIEPLLSAEQDSAEAVWANDVDVRVGKLCRGYFRLLQRVQIIADLDRAAADVPVVWGSSK